MMRAHACSVSRSVLLACISSFLDVYLENVLMLWQNAEGPKVVIVEPDFYDSYDF